MITNISAVSAIRDLVEAAEAAGFDHDNQPILNKARDALAYLQFQAFRATRRWSENLGKDLSDESLMGVTGYLYCDALYIETERMLVEGNDTARMIIGNMQHAGSLADMEKILFEFARDEGYLVETEGSLVAELDAYCTRENLPHQSAEDLLASDITDQQRSYLTAFVARWDDVMGGKQ